MDLNFDLHNMFASNEMEEFNCFPNMPGSKCKSYKFTTEDLELFDRVRCEFVRRVDQFMQHYQGAKIHSLRVDFLLGETHNDIIDRWIVCAIAKGAERIELFFSNRTYFLPGQKPYKFPHSLFSDSDVSCLNYLHLQNCLLLPHAKFSGFQHLRTLLLDQLAVEEDLLLCLFSECFHLEDLTFRLCQFNYVININSPTLHHLKLLHCVLPWRLSIVTPKLESFEYSGNVLCLSSIDAPQLGKLYLNPISSMDKEIPHAFAQLARFHHLENLTMVLSHSQIARIPKTFGPLQHLRQLELFFFDPLEENEDYLWVLNIVMACPHLQKLSLVISCANLFTKQRQRRENTGFSHNELKYVELHGCVGHTYEIELATYFLKNVNSLEQITFDPSGRFNIGGEQWFDGFDNPYWFQTGRNFIREMLQDDVNGRTQLIFL